MIGVVAFRSNRSGGTESKALAKSRKITQKVSCLWGSYGLLEFIKEFTYTLKELELTVSKIQQKYDNNWRHFSSIRSKIFPNEIVRYPVLI